MFGAPLRFRWVGRGNAAEWTGPMRWRRSSNKMDSIMLHYRIRRKQIPVGTLPPVLCQYDWRDGCDKTATWRVGCGTDVRFYCDSHEGPPCGGVFLGEFVITPDTTREKLAGVVSGGSHRRIPRTTCGWAGSDPAGCRRPCTARTSWVGVGCRRKLTLKGKWVCLKLAKWH